MILLFIQFASLFDIVRLVMFFLCHLECLLYHLIRSPIFLIPSLTRLFFFSIKVIFAVSPLLVLFYVVYSGFDSKEEEDRRRNKKEDFRLDGHAE